MKIIGTGEKVQAINCGSKDSGRSKKVDVSIVAAL